MKTTLRHSYQTIAAFVLVSFSFALTANGQQNALVVDPAQSLPQQTVNEAPAVQTPIKLLTNYFEAGGSYENLTSNFGHWNGGYFRTVFSTGRNTWNAEVNGEHEFGDAGEYFAAGDTVTISSNWYASLTLGTSNGGFFWPRYRADGFIHRKWGERRQFITTIGFGYDAAKDVHRDHSAFIGTTYYFQGPWIIEEGARLNISDPGTVYSPSGFLAITEGRNKEHYITLNLGAGQEAYQIIGPTSELTRFPSQTASLTWRQWVGRNWGLNFVGDVYHSPFYHRGGGSIGFFKEF